MKSSDNTEKTLPLRFSYLNYFNKKQLREYKRDRKSLIKGFEEQKAICEKRIKKLWDKNQTLPQFSPEDRKLLNQLIYGKCKAERNVLLILEEVNHCNNLLTYKCNGNN